MAEIKVKPIASYSMKTDKVAEDAIQDFLNGKISPEQFAKTFSEGKVDFIPIEDDREITVIIPDERMN